MSRTGTAKPASRSKAKAPAVAKPRQPQQARSRIRHMKILEATVAELERSGLEGLSFHRVAESAGVPAASVYQYFPSKFALIFALAEHLFGEFKSQFLEHLERSRARSWQAFIRDLVQTSAGIHNSNAAIRLLFIGSQGSREVRVMDKSFNSFLAHEIVEQFERRYGIPQSAKLEQVMTIAVELFDTIAAVAMRRSGHIDAFHLREAERAVVSYLESFLAAYAQGADDG
jgi:AcrR family transcriptional regulator